MSVYGSCAPQELLALQDGLSPRSSTGQHGSSNQLVSYSKGAEVLSDGEVPFDSLLSGLPSDIVGHIFLFGSLSDVYNCVGVCSLRLHKGVWQQPDFWMALGGPVFLEKLDFPKSALVSAAPDLDPAATTISAFRRWLYCLDGEWIEELERLALDETPEVVLEEAFSRIQGLQLGDVCDSDLWRVIQVVAQAMQRLNPAHCSTQTAVALVECCNRRQHVFNFSQLSSLRSELGNLQERALQQQLWSTESHEDEKPLDPWTLDTWSLDLDQYDSKPLTGAFGGHQGQCLSLGFLAIMDESNLAGMAS